MDEGCAGPARIAFVALLKQARTRERTGVGPRSDVEQAQAFYDATEQTVIDAQNALTSSLFEVGGQLRTFRMLKHSVDLRGRGSPQR
jgi:hypothetical protein